MGKNVNAKDHKLSTRRRRWEEKVIYGAVRNEDLKPCEKRFQEKRETIVWVLTKKVRLLAAHITK